MINLVEEQTAQHTQESMSLEQGFVITKTPFRISLFGGGTDFPDYYNENGGCVIGSAIDKHIYVTLNSLPRFFDKKIRLSYSKLEEVNHPQDLAHPIVRTILSEHDKLSPSSFLDIHTFADLPASSGVGSSSAFTVGMLNAIYSLKGVYKGPECLAKEAIHVERDRLKEIGGHQDQYFSAFGGFNKITFNHGNTLVTPICMSPRKLRYIESSGILIFTGATRSSSSIQSHFSSISKEKKRLLDETKLVAEEASAILQSEMSNTETVRKLGQLLHQAWLVKKSMDKSITSSAIDDIYDRALELGAYGGKVCGAGGGGFILLLVPVEARENIIKKLTGLHVLPLRFDMSGSHVLHSSL